MYVTHLQRTISYCRHTFILAPFLHPHWWLRTPCFPFHAELYSEAVCSAVEETLVKETNVESANEVQWKGTQYKKGLFLCLNQSEALEFGQIELMLVMPDQHVYFIATPHDVSYMPAFALYEVKQARQSMKCWKPDKKLDYYPLPVYKLCGTRVISLKHSIVDSQ